ncbi:hypothetical protein EVAR_69044_1 [Eumeta japonica]|uniref:Uncharacterized protein n=1 Tax=Eumeta variegata TaxID=151549 RepID=A0A4C1ZHD9_EUMVA|nr:hypothetical protein EVAR_69044_1 [Eumeta japonica]
MRAKNYGGGRGARDGGAPGGDVAAAAREAATGPLKLRIRCHYAARREAQNADTWKAVFAFIGFSGKKITTPSRPVVSKPLKSPLKK